MNKSKEIIRKITVCLLLTSLLWGCGQGEEKIEKERTDEDNTQTEETVQTEEEVIFDDSVNFADATMKEIISEACKGETDKEHLEAITVLRLSLSKDEEPIVVLDDLALLPGLKQLYIDVQPECGKQMVLDYGYLKNMDELTELTIHDKNLTDISFVKQMNALQSLDVSDCSIEDYAGLEYLPELDNLSIGGNPGDPLQVLRKRGAEVLTASADDKEAWKNELEKALDVYNPLTEESDEFKSEVEDWCVGDFNGDGVNDLGIVIGRIDDEVASVPIQRRLYLYLGNEEGYEEPLNPLPLLSGYGHENSFQGLIIRDEKVFAEYCFDSQDTLLTDMEIYEYRDEEWQYVLYTTDQKDCFGVYDFENDSFTVYTWRYAADDKGEYVKRWGNSLSDIFVYYDRIPYFLQLSQVDETVYEFYTYGFDYGIKELVRVDFFQVNSLTGDIDAYLDI